MLHDAASLASPVSSAALTDGHCHVCVSVVLELVPFAVLVVMVVSSPFNGIDQIVFVTSPLVSTFVGKANK